MPFGTDMIRCDSGLFKLDTPDTTYMFRISPQGHPEHLYYGPLLSEVGDPACYATGQGLRIPTIVKYSEDAPFTAPAAELYEAFGTGKGDLRDGLFQGEWGAGGNTVFDFRYEGYRIEKDAAPLDPRLPGARRTGAETLTLTLADTVTQVRLDLLYTVYPDSNVILRQSRVRNDSQELLTIRALYSMQLDLVDSGFEALSFDGAWIRERHPHRTPVRTGTFSFHSTAGTSSADHNPLLILSGERDAYLFNLIWSGDHKESVECSSYGTLRVLSGIDPTVYSYRLAPGESFVSPEAVMCYSDAGENVLSEAARSFLTRYISPVFWQEKERPILLNSWEGMGFDLSETKIRQQVDAAAELGIELFVLDDGWFRPDDTCGLGDWEPDPLKFPNGLKAVSDYIHGKGMLAGIWVEPEMISTRSRLFADHPEYRVACPGRKPGIERNQYLLDLTRPEVIDMLYAVLERLIAENDFDYVKWDMNRYTSDDWLEGGYTPEFRYRRTLGFYDLSRRLRDRFPRLLLEGCASGGARFDAGVLAFADQIWGSDNTDAVCRVPIFLGTTYGYPLRTFGAHVSRIPNGITGRVYDYETAFNVNAFGAFGYELDITVLSEQEKRIFADQICFYKQYRSLFQLGKLTRISEEDPVVWSVENAEADQILVLYYEAADSWTQEKLRKLRVPSCKADRMYRVRTRRQWVTAPEMTARRGGPHLSEVFERAVPGALLRGQGMSIMPVFLGTNYPEGTAYFGEHGSRIFIVEEIK